MRWTSRSRAGPVSVPSQPKRSSARSTIAGGSTFLPSASTVRVRRTATRRSWRNSGSSRSTVPCQFAAIVSASSASTARKPTTAGIVGSSGTPAGPDGAARSHARGGRGDGERVAVEPRQSDVGERIARFRSRAWRIPRARRPRSSIGRRRGRRYARARSIATVATILPARLCLTPAERVAVTRSDREQRPHVGGRARAEREMVPVAGRRGNEEPTTRRGAHGQTPRPSE